MKLYLVQHGEAKSKDEDPDRHLTEKGRRDVEKAAAFLKTAGLSASAVWHSGKTRAAETAGILARALGLEGAVVEHAGLAPNDPVEPVRDEVDRAAGGPDGGLGGGPGGGLDKDLMIVGHLPFMEKLASLLVAQSDSAGVVAFRQGGVVCLERTDDGSWSVLWAVVPELLP